MTNLSSYSNTQLFGQYAAILNELLKRDVIRTANASASDYAE